MGYRSDLRLNATEWTIKYVWAVIYDLLFTRFLNLKMKSMVFEDSVFEECYFEDITSTHTFFRNCTFIASLFYNTGKYERWFASVFRSDHVHQGGHFVTREFELGLQIMNNLITNF